MDTETERLKYSLSAQGWIPQSIIDKALSGAQLEYIDNIRKRAADILR